MEQKTWEQSLPSCTLSEHCPLLIVRKKKLLKTSKNTAETKLSGKVNWSLLLLIDIAESLTMTHLLAQDY